MTEHRGTSFYNSCVKVPIDPYSRQPTPSYERGIGSRKSKQQSSDLYDKSIRINVAKDDRYVCESETSSPREIVDNFLEFLESIPDYGQVHHLSNEQFKRKVDYLRRRQKLLLENLQTSLSDDKNTNVCKFATAKCNEKPKMKSKNAVNGLTLSGKKCYLEESRTSSPVFFLPSKFDGLSEDQDFLTNRCNGKDKRRNEASREEKICSSNEWRELNNDCNIDSDTDSIETRSLPASITKDWHPTVPKPFSFTLREEAEKYTTSTEREEPECKDLAGNKKSVHRKRRVRPIPLTSKLPLYDKLLAEKEERSRMIREESALNLMSQVRPFRLECDRRAWRSFARSSPEIRSKSTTDASGKFKAKPVPKNLFSTEVYDRMLEDEYYRQLQKKVRAAQLMKSSSLPPSMARRERVKCGTSARLKGAAKAAKNTSRSPESKNAKFANNNLMPLERCKSEMSFFPIRGNNLAAILRCQVSREKLEREIKEKMEEKRREQEARLRESLIGRNPVWRALRSAARHEHERDLSIRTSLRRDEAREQAERHRLHMEMMLDRVTQIPTLFERHSQSYQSLTKSHQKASDSKTSRGMKKSKLHRRAPTSAESYMDYENVSRSDSGSLTSSSPSHASKSSKSSSASTSRSSEKSASKSQSSLPKRKGDRGHLKVSINETAELIEDPNEGDELRETEYEKLGEKEYEKLGEKEYEKLRELGEKEISSDDQDEIALRSADRDTER